jgi:hypothetical protein
MYERKSHSQLLKELSGSQAAFGTIFIVMGSYLKPNQTKRDLDRVFKISKWLFKQAKHYFKFSLQKPASKQLMTQSF